MPVAATDIEIRLSVTTGPGDSTAQANPNASLGEFMSTTEMGTSLHSLFDLATGADDAESDVEYRCIFVYNAHATDTAFNVLVWVDNKAAGGSSVALAPDGTGIVAGNSASPQAEEEVDEDTAPTGESFAAHATIGNAIVVGDLAAGECIAIWVRRTLNNNGPADADGFDLKVTFDTAE